MKYNVGDEFISEVELYKDSFESYIIVDRDLNNNTYKISYKNTKGNYPDVDLHEAILEEDVINGYVSYNSKFAYFNNTGEIAKRKGYTAIDENICRHPNKYLNKVFTMQFYVCPDCKKEV